MSENKTYTIADIQKEIRTLKLDEEEQELLLASYNESPKSASNKAELLKLSKVAARNTLKRDARVTFRISQRTLRQLKATAAELEIPYQNLINLAINEFIKRAI